MSTGRHQRPEHVVIIDYVQGLIDDGVVTLAKMADALPPIYDYMIPTGRQKIGFEVIHRHDSAAEYTRKRAKNRKELERILKQVTRFPLSLRNPLIYAVEQVAPGAGAELHRRLVRNQGLLYIPMHAGVDGDAIYAEFVDRFAAANSAVVDDIRDDQVLDDPKTRHALLGLLEQVVVMLRALDKAMEDVADE